MDQQAKLQGLSPSSSSFYNHRSQVKIEWYKHTELEEELIDNCEYKS